MRNEFCFQLGVAAREAARERTYVLDEEFMTFFRMSTKYGDAASEGAYLRSSWYAGFDFIDEK